jgi:hypothetical protein
VPDTTTPQKYAAPARPTGLPIGAWLVLGYALVIGAFAVATVVSLKSTRDAAAGLARMQQQFEPLSHSVRDLGDGLATFDRAVLAHLRAEARDNRAATVKAAERLSRAANRIADVESTTEPRSLDPLLREIADHQAAGLKLLSLQDERRRTIENLEQAFNALDRRIEGAGGAGVVVGNSLMDRP